MTTGTDSFGGLYVPLYGNFTIKARVGATDIMTIEGAGSTGDFIVCRDSAATEVFVVEDSGEVVMAGGATIACLLTCTKALAVTTDATVTCLLTASKALTVTTGDLTISAGDVAITKGYYLRFSSWPVTIPTTGLTLGDVFLAKISTNAQVAVVIDGSNTIRYLNTTSA